MNTTAANTTVPAVTIAHFAELVTTLNAEANAWFEAYHALPSAERNELSYAHTRYMSALWQLQGASARLAELVTAHHAV